MSKNTEKQEQYDNKVNTVVDRDGVLVDFAKKRWDKMAYNAGRTNFEERTKQVYWLRDTYEDGLTYAEHFRRDIRFPTLNTIITDALDDLIEVLPESEFVAVDEDFENNKRRAKLITKARDDFAIKGNKEDEVYKALRHAYTEGVGYLYVGRARTFKPDGSVLFDGIDYEAINPLSLFTDENATVLHDPKLRKGCRDVFRHYRMSLSTWHSNLQNNKEFYNKDSVKPQNEQIRSRLTDRQEDDGMQGREMVDILEYWNRELIWEANGKTLVGIHAIFSLQGGNMVEHFVESSTRIPFAAYYREKRDDSIYGVPLAEELANIIIAQDQQITLAFREAQLAQMPPTIIRAGAGFNRRKHTIRPNGIWQLKIPDNMPINNVIQTIQRPGLPADFYNLRNIFDNEIVKVSKQDPRDLIRRPNELATQVKARIQSEKKKVNSIVRLNTWGAERTVAQLELDVIDRFLKFPLKDFKNGKETQRNRIITVKGFDIINDDLVPELKKNNGGRSGQFKLTKDLMETDFDVMIVDRKQERLMEGEKEGRLLQFLQIRTNLLSVPPEIGKKVEPLVMAIGEILGLKQNEIDTEDDITTKSPREEQLELIALGKQPTIDKDIGDIELIRMRKSWAMFKTKPIYENLDDRIKKGIDELIDSIEQALLQPEEPQQAREQDGMMAQGQPTQPQGQPQLPPTQPKTGNIPAPNNQLLSATAMQGNLPSLNTK